MPSHFIFTISINRLPLQGLTSLPHGLPCYLHVELLWVSFYSMFFFVFFHRA